MKTYISLFSSAGIGCYGFKQEGFECIATNEIIKRRLEIQKNNNKCKYETGYICGDITDETIKKQLYDEINFWKQKEKIKGVDVVIATPPCQGMSVANHKKTDFEIVRNSLVVESIKIIKEIQPKFFVFENVPAFMKTICTDIDGINKPISEAIRHNLGESYSYTYKIINFKNFGACSSRSRTLVIGVRNDYASEVSPFELYPEMKPERTLRQVIGSLKSLKVFGEIDPGDIYHSFRTYPEHMREWISGLKEGESAFENEDDNKKPHQIIDGKPVINKNKNGDKYRRQIWDKVGPCVHTRNDQLASQNTIHPEDDRVFSIRELMLMMTVPTSFNWSDKTLEYLNNLSLEEKKAYLKKEEIKIRQSLGEAVPTIIFQGIASNISKVLSVKLLSSAAIKRIVSDCNFQSPDEIATFIKDNPLQLSLATLSKIAEITNSGRSSNAAFYTNKVLITQIIEKLPDMDNDTIKILEPSVGVANFVPLIIKRFEGKNLNIDLVDIDDNSIRIARILLEKYGIPSNCHINFITDDFLLHKFGEEYDLVIGNPPFLKIKNNPVLLKKYQTAAINKNTSNICSFFLDKALQIGKFVAIVFPKFLLNTPEFAESRKYISQKNVECIIDFGEKGFPGVLIETIALFINNIKRPSKTKVFSLALNLYLEQKQSYIFDDKLPYWVIYRNELFDKVFRKMDFGCFTVFRDRQITNKYIMTEGDIRVLKSRNISDDGTKIIDIEKYDGYISADKASKFAVSNFIDSNNVYITPNMTYYPRVMKKPKGMLVNGSLAILIPKDNITLSEEQCLYFSSDEYRVFYKIARNYQTRSLNVDACSVFFYGILRRAEDEMSDLF